MREGWQTVKLGDISERQIGRTPPRKDPRYWTTDMSRPFCTIASMNPHSIRGVSEGVTELAEADGKAKRVPAGSLLLSFKLSIGRVVITDRDVFPNEAIAWIQPKQGVLQSYLALALEGVDWDSMGGRAVKGRTLNSASLDAVEIPLPPLAEQRRIVDLIGALDETIAAANQCLSSSTTFLEHLRAIEGIERTEPLGSLVTMRSGPSWKSQDESDSPGPGRHPVLGITNTPAGTGITTEPQKFVSGLSTSVQRLTGRSLVMIRTNGNRSRIGNVYQATPRVEGYAVSAFQIAIEPNLDVDSSFLHWYLGSRRVQDDISGMASGSTGLGNIAVGKLKQLPIPVLEAGEQEKYLDRCEAANELVKAANDVTAHLREVRSNTLTALLSGEHEIPESYNAVMEAAA